MLIIGGQFVCCDYGWFSRDLEAFDQDPQTCQRAFDPCQILSEQATVHFWFTDFTLRKSPEAAFVIRLLQCFQFHCHFQNSFRSWLVAQEDGFSVQLSCVTSVSCRLCYCYLCFELMGLTLRWVCCPWSALSCYVYFSVRSIESSISRFLTLDHPICWGQVASRKHISSYYCLHFGLILVHEMVCSVFTVLWSGVPQDSVP